MYKATVIINTVNEVPERLRDAINSYVAQTNVDLQIIVSTIEGDISVGISKELGVECVINPEKGIYQQLNNAVKFINGDWWCYASGNDIAEPNKISQEIQCCINNNKLICYSDFFKKNIENNSISISKFINYDYKKHLEGNFVNDCSIIHTSLNKYLPFRFEQWGNDSHYDFWLRVYESEGDVFCHNPNPTWTYCEWNDSKHIQRRNNKEELELYKVKRTELIDSHKTPLITIGLPTYKSKIVWLALESLCRQRTNFNWELIVCEEIFDGNGEQYFNQYKDRLLDVNCVRIKYISITDKSEITDRKALSVKWKMIADEASSSSIGLILQANDCYSEPDRVQNTFKRFNEGCDWLQNRFGVFYNLINGKSILFDMCSLNEDCTGLNMALRMSIAKSLPYEEKYKYVDYWMNQNARIIKPDLKVFTDESDNWMNGIDTDGANMISKREKYYECVQPPFVSTNLSLKDCVPIGVSNLLLGESNISQCFVSDSIKFFRPHIMNKFKFDVYYDINKPAVFWGCYSQADVDRILNHKGLAIIQWAGTDAMLARNTDAFVGNDNVKHISASVWTNKDLEKAGLKYYFLPISIMSRPDIQEEPLGDKIYVYTSAANPDFYGKRLYDKLIEIFGRENFIIAHSKSFSKDALMNAYKNSFIGLRLLEHDGLSETVCELGLMGRNVIHNGNTPNSLHYENFEDIVNHINNEMLKTGTINTGLREKMFNYLNINNDWLTLDFYK